MALVVAIGNPTPSYAGIDEWLRSVMNNGRHADKHYRPPRVKKTKTVDPLKALRHQMVTGDDLSEKQLGTLVKNGDDLAAFKLAQKIEAENDPERLDSAMRYYAQAFEGGREFAAPSIIRLLDTGVAADDPELLERTEGILEKQAIKDAGVRDALIRMYQSGKPFGEQAEKADALLVAAAESGDAQAALDLAYAQLKGGPAPENIEKAKGYLEIAAKADDLAIRTQAENILRGLQPGQPPILTVASETAQ
jgi:TPR repeat protein